MFREVYFLKINSGTQNEDITYIPSVKDWNNSSPVLGNRLKSRLGHVKVWSRRIAPTTIVIRECQVWRTEICGSNCNGSAPEAPLGCFVCITNYLIATAAWFAIIEQSSAQCSSFYSITICVEISIATCTPYNKNRNMLVVTHFISYALVLYYKFSGYFLLLQKWWVY